jgi:hypothetical protein
MTDNILIFRTSIEKRQEIKKIEKLFTQYPQIHVWNVDLEDWEKILRIECQGITPTDISDALSTIDICATELE